MLEKHEELIQISKEGKDYKSELENRERRLEFVDLDIRTKKSRVENFLDREKQHNVINLLKKKHTLIVSISVAAFLSLLENLAMPRKTS